MLVYGLVLLLAVGSFSSPARVRKTRVQKFKNFPVVGLKESAPEPVFELEPVVEVEEHPRDARQVGEYRSEPENLDDVFVEEAVYLTPEDREQRALAKQHGQDELFHDESLDTVDNVRAERDGAHGHHGGHNRNRGGRANHRAAPAPLTTINDEYDNYEDSYDDDYDYEEPQPQQQQQRRGKQSGATGLALGVLSSPPSSDGNYNFNFANDDGSSRQEVGAPDAIRGSYSFVTPEGEQVNVQYHADETGFHATGSHVPQAPPMPAHVQRLLDHLAKVNGLERL